MSNIHLLEEMIIPNRYMKNYQPKKCWLMQIKNHNETTVHSSNNDYYK